MLVKNSTKAIEDILLHHCEPCASRMELEEEQEQNLTSTLFYSSTRLSWAEECEQDGEDIFYWIDMKVDIKSHESSIENSTEKADTCIQFTTWLPHRDMPLPLIQEESEQDLLEMD